MTSTAHGRDDPEGGSRLAESVGAHGDERCTATSVEPRTKKRAKAVDSCRRLEQTWQLFRTSSPRWSSNDEQAVPRVKDRIRLTYGFGGLLRGGWCGVDRTCSAISTRSEAESPPRHDHDAKARSSSARHAPEVVRPSPLAEPTE